MIGDRSSEQRPTGDGSHDPFPVGRRGAPATDERAPGLGETAGTAPGPILERASASVLDALPDPAAVLSPVRSDDGSLIGLRLDRLNAAWRAHGAGGIGPDQLGTRVEGALERVGLHLAIADRVLGGGEPWHGGGPGSDAPGVATVLAAGRWDGRLLVTARDDRWRAAEDAFVERERDLRETLEDVDAIISIRRSASDRFVLSPQVERILGYPPEELAPFGSWRALIHPDDISRTLAVWAGPDESWETEYRVRRADDTWAWVRERGRRTLDREGKPGRIVSVVADVTESRMLREQLLRAGRLESLGRLASGVAHDFDNVLYGISTIAGFLDRDLAGTPAHAEVRSILEATERGRELTHRLLVLAGVAPLVPADVDLAESLETVRRLLEPVLGDSVVLDIAVGRGLDAVFIDRSGLERAIVDLGLNARDSMPRGGWITIAAEAADVDELEAVAAGIEPGRYARVSVADTGTGIAPERLAHLFDPFFSETPESIGMGLGLPLVYAFAHASGGGIGVETEVGTGSTFLVYLPLG